MFFHLASMPEVSNDVFSALDYPPYVHKETQKFSKTYLKELHNVSGRLAGV